MERAVVMTGIGGQGIQLIAKLLGEAGMREQRQVMMFGLFHGSIRGGSSESTVVLADAEIVAPPIVPSVWGVVAMHGEGLPKLAPKIERGGVLVRNDNIVTRAPGWEGVADVAIAATDEAKTLGQPLGASMIVLGAFAAATGIVTLESLGQALERVLPAHRQKHIAANRACLERGAALVGRSGTTAWS